MSTAETPSFLRAPGEASPAALEVRFASLAEAVARLEARVATLEGVQQIRPRLVEAVLPGAPLPAAELPGPARILALLGRVCLVLGGATFIRALVDAGTLHRGWGVALGLAYAITWALLADRARSPLDAAFHALASILVAYPLLVESTARFGILDPGLAALLLLAVTGLHSAVAWRRDLQPILWTATLASLGSGLVLMTARQSVEPFLGVFFILGAGALWFTLDRRWQGLRWPGALAADLGVLILTSLLAWPGGAPEAYRGLSPLRAMAFALLLPGFYLGSFALRRFQRRPVARTFELVQSALALLLGLGGALRVALATGSGAVGIGLCVTLAGLGCYGAATRFAGEEEEARSTFHFFTFLALLLLLLGGSILLPRALFAPLAGALGLGAMLAGLRLRRTVLLAQSGIYLGAATLASGLAAWSLRAFLDPAGPLSPLAPGGLLSLAVLATTLGLFLLRRPAGAVASRFQPVLLGLGFLVSAGVGALAIRLCCPGPATDPGLLAVVRTAVLSSLALALAWSGRRLPELELRWLVYPLLIVTALKFLFEDLAVGRPLTLFVGFMCFGATLMLAPRLLKVPAPSDGESDPNPPKPEVDP